MTTGTIKQGVAAFVITTVMPSFWPNPDSVTASVYRLNGAVLADNEDLSVSLYAGDTLNGAVSAFTKACTLTTGNELEDGETVNIGSDAQGFQELVVDSYNSDSQVLTLKDRFDEGLVDGSAVIGRTMTLEIDSSAWAFIENVTIVWTPVGISKLPFTESYSVLKRESASAGLESAFRDSFDDFYPHVQGHFDRAYNYAHGMVRRHLKLSDRDLLKIVDSAEYEYLLMTRMALNIALAHGAQFDSRVEKLSESYDMQLSILLDSEQWEDTNQDLVQDESEVTSGSRIGTRRGQ